MIDKNKNAFGVVNSYYCKMFKTRKNQVRYAYSIFVIHKNENGFRSDLGKYMQ